MFLLLKYQKFLTFWSKTKNKICHVFLCDFIWNHPKAKNGFFVGKISPTLIDDVKLIHRRDEDQVCLKYMKPSKIHGKPQIPVYIGDTINLILVIHFCCYSALKKTSFGVCSYSELLQLKFFN